MSPIVGLIISYLAGSIPSAYISGRLRGVDLRKHGSGNLGATNVVRVLGAKTGAVVFIADLLKGFLPVYFLPMYTETLRPGMWALFFGAAAIIGHVKPIFLLWKGGGKGVATASGVFLAAPKSTDVCAMSPEYEPGDDDARDEHGRLHATVPSKNGDRQHGGCEKRRETDIP